MKLLPGSRKHYAYSLYKLKVSGVSPLGHLDRFPLQSNKVRVAGVQTKVANTKHKISLPVVHCVPVFSDHSLTPETLSSWSLAQVLITYPRNVLLTNER